HFRNFPPLIAFDQLPPQKIVEAVGSPAGRSDEVLTDKRGDNRSGAFLILSRVDKVDRPDTLDGRVLPGEDWRTRIEKCLWCCDVLKTGLLFLAESPEHRFDGRERILVALIRPICAWTKLTTNGFGDKFFVVRFHGRQT